MPRMRCHYDVLGIERDADTSAIKKSYRKLALQYHPDKNADRIEEATKLFNEVQAAYDCLSDPQERAFYDKHRDAILMGNSDFVDEALNLMPYFSTSAFEGFKDNEHGFYSVYREVFKKIAEEDEAHLEGSDIDEYDIPEFGDSKSSFEDVVRTFYSHWQGYCTTKTFAWVVKYDIRQAPNRPTQRLMEKENKKVRDKKRKERNDEVRALVAFVRKRDKRVIAYRKELEAKQKEQKERFEKKRLEEKKNRLKDFDNYEEPEWMKMDEDELNKIDSEFGGGQQDTYEDSDEELVEEAFYCVACDKTFKTAKALTNHEQSKKHKENIELIKLEMNEEMLQELHLDGGGGNSNEVDSGAEGEDPRGDVDVENINDMMADMNINEVEEEIDLDSVATDGKTNGFHAVDDVEINEDLFDDGDEEEEMLRGSRKKEKKKKNKMNAVYEAPSLDVEDVPLPTQDNKSKSSKKAKKMRRNKNKQANDEDEENASPSKEESSKENKQEPPAVNNQAKQKKKPRRRKKKGDSSEDELEETETKLDSNKTTNKINNNPTNDTDRTKCNSNDDDNEMTTTPEDTTKTLITDFASLKDTVSEKEKNTSATDKSVNPVLVELDGTMYAINSNITGGDDEEEGSIILPQAPNLKREVRNLKSQAAGDGDDDGKTGEFDCKICSKVYPSKTKLFSHIKAEGHAALKTDMDGDDDGRGKKKKKNKGKNQKLK